MKKHKTTYPVKVSKKSGLYKIKDFNTVFKTVLSNDFMLNMNVDFDFIS